jgi:hypothetical protein
MRVRLRMLRASMQLVQSKHSSRRDAASCGIGPLRQSCIQRESYTKGRTEGPARPTCPFPNVLVSNLKVDG